MPRDAATETEPDRLADLLRHLRQDHGQHGEHLDDLHLDDLHLDGPHVDGPHVDDSIGEDEGWAVPDGRHRRGRVPVVSVPESVRSVDLTVRPAAVRGLLVVALVVVLVLTGRWGWATLRAAPEPVAVSAGRDGAPGVEHASDEADSRPEEGGPSAPVAAVDPTSSTAQAPAPRPARLLVHVAGQVASPGVVDLPAGSRVIDAVEAAGGFAQEADQGALNLARPLVDGEQVWVGRPGEAPPAGAVVPGPGMPSSSAPGTVTAGAPAGLLDLNAADQAALEELPGIGPVTAGHILAWREAHGRFTSVDELLEVSGIGERTLAQLEPLVTVSG
ncbi:helix-hairpin-helix domain-containing protein [Ornithinimicrobium tianjinense]|nr:helix-hairpin-helix domain-containing protein [Ornithinimicrobium tianjinense]